jgi:UDP-2,3-diacylglucosamine hydrolase
MPPPAQGEHAAVTPSGAGIACLRATPGWQRIDFISDLHLTEDRPLTFAAFDRLLRHTTADAVFILGDLFEVWVGDDARHGRFESRCAATLAAASERRFVAFMAGNRDFLVGRELLDACGLQALDDPTVLDLPGERLLLTHGDAWCLADHDYQRFRAEVRDPAWRRSVLARPLAERLALGAAMRAESERLKREKHDDLWADVDAPTAVRTLQSVGAHVLLHGHTHRPGSDLLAPGLVRHVLSDWELDEPGIAPRAEVLRWSRDGLTRLSVDAAVTPVST